MRKIFFILLLITLQGCSSVYARFAYDFNEHKKIQGIFYESGAEDIASEVSEGLNQFVSIVEKNNIMCLHR